MCKNCGSTRGAQLHHCVRIRALISMLRERTDLRKKATTRMHVRERKRPRRPSSRGHALRPMSNTQTCVVRDAMGIAFGGWRLTGAKPDWPQLSIPKSDQFFLASRLPELIANTGANPVIQESIHCTKERDYSHTRRSFDQAADNNPSCVSTRSSSNG